MKKSKVILGFLLIIVLLLILGTRVQAQTVGVYTLEDGCITRILPEITVAEFKNNLSTKKEVVVKDKAGLVVEDSSIVKTGMTLEFDGTSYKTSVVGDLNGDGKITVTDVVQCNLHVVNIKKLEGERAKSADINNDGKTSITDLVQLKLIQVNIKNITDFVKYIEELEEEPLHGMIEKEYKPEEDEDKDGLTNGEEVVLGTNINDADTDGDGLTDYYEVNISKTDPLKVDTDGDGINDGDEIAMELNPLAIDSKGDGINDSQRILTYKVQDEKSGVDINITGKGNIASTTIDTLDKPESEQRNDVLDTIYNFHTKGTMESATVTIKYTMEELEEKELTEDNISLYYIDTDNNKIEKVASTVDKENKTITATLEHFSMYIIGKEDIANFSFNSNCDSWVDVNHDGIADEIVIVNSGFNPKVNGFSFENFSSTKSDGGNCYGMATFAMAYYIDKLPLIGEADKFWTFKDFGSIWETKGYDLTGTYFENGGNLYDFKIKSEPLKYILGDLWNILDQDGIKDKYIKIKEEYYNELNKIGTIYKDVKVKRDDFNKYQKPLLNVESEKLKNNVTNDENEMLNAIWNLYMLQAHDDFTSWGSDPDLAFKELQANLQNGVPVVLSTRDHAINAISLIQDLKDTNKYKIAIYDNNYPGEIRYIDVIRYKYNKFTFDWTAWTNEYGYKCTYNGEKINLAIHYPKLAETNSIYATLYDDGTLAFTATDKVIEGKTVVEKYGDVYKKETTPWGKDRDKITKVDIVDPIKPKTTQNWFYRLTNLQTIDNINNLDTREITDMGAMFAYCDNLINLDLSKFDTSKVTDMEEMFLGCSSLTSLDLSSFNTSNVINMEGMFFGCSSLTSLNLSKFDTSNVTDMTSMFCKCSSLRSLDLSSFNASNVKSLKFLNMFNYCTNLTTIYVGPNWFDDDIDGGNKLLMFYECGTDHVTKV